MASLFHPNQSAAANEVIEHFSGAVHRYVLLMAPCQSGKTGTFHAVAHEALTRGLVDRVYLICGSPEKVLQAQAHEDAAEYSEEFVRDSRFQIIFHGDFTKKTFDRRRALMIVDESHMDQGKDQKMKQFLFANGIDLWGTTPRMVAEETFILSVSATPYSELSNIYHGVTPRKVIVELTPGESYVGVGDYWYQGRIHETFSIKEQWPRFAELVKSKGAKWNLIRCYGGAEDSNYTFIRALASIEGINVYDYTQTKMDIAITRVEQLQMRSLKNKIVPSLEDVPAKPSIVLLKGKLRAGKVVPKNNIGFVWEDSSSPNTDTIVQSLLGRMCGYKFGAEKPEVFLCHKMVAESKSLIRQNNLVRHTMMPLMMPMKGRNVKGGALPSAEGHARHPCVPLLLRFADIKKEYEDEAALLELRRFDTCQDASAKQFLARVLAADDSSLVRNHQGLSAQQKAEIIAAITSNSARIGVRHFHKDVSVSHMNFLDVVAQAHAAGTCPVERVAQDPPLAFLIFHEGARHVGTELWSAPQSGDVFVYFNAAAKGVGFMGKQSLKTRIPQTTGNEIFRCRLEPEVAGGSEAGIALGFSSNVCQNPTTLKKQLRSILAFEREQRALGEDGMPVNRLIKGLAEGKVMRLNKAAYHYESTGVSELARMLAELGEEFKVKFTVERGISTPQFEGIKSIKWM